MSTTLSPEIEETVDITIKPKVILFNDSIHTFDQVVYQVQLATGFNLERAESITMEAHTSGSSIVWSGEIERCLQVSSVLESINLRTQIDF